MKKLTLIALAILVSVEMAHSRDTEEMELILRAIVQIAIPTMTFLFSAIIAIFVTRSIVNANARTKIAQYDMLKKFAETGAPLPKGFKKDLENTVEVKADIKGRNLLKFIGIVASVCGIIMLINVRNFSGDLPEFISSLILIAAAVCCFWFYFKVGMMTQKSDQESQNNSQNCPPNNSQNMGNGQDNQSGNSQQ